VPHPLDRLDHVGAGLALHINDHGRLALVPGPDLGVLQTVDNLRNVAQEHRRVVAIGNHQRAVGFGGGELVVGRDGVGLVRAIERALGAGNVGANDRSADILKPDAVSGQPSDVGLDAHRGPDSALHRNAADACDLRQPLRHQRIGQVAHFAQRDGL
jgi:hypothetical protein